MQRLKGLIAAPFTPLDNKGELALEKIDTLVQLYENNGVNGVFVAGSTGEGVSLSHEEKKVLLTYWAKAKGKRIKALFMLGGTCLKELQELATKTVGNGHYHQVFFFFFFFCCCC